MAYKVTYGAPAVLPVSFGELGPEYGNEPIGLQDRAVIDVNGDGFEDIFIMGFTGSGYGPIVPVKLLVSNGTTLIDRTSEFLPDAPVSDGPRNVYVADFNGDGRDDVFISNAGTETVSPFAGAQNRLLLSNLATGVYDDVTATHLPQMTDFPHGGGVGDFDGDGDVDIFLNQLGQDEFIYPYLMLNDGNGVMTIVDEQNANNIPGSWFPTETDGAGFYYAHVFDMNGDGYADIWTSGLNYYDPWPNLDHTDFRGLVSNGTSFELRPDVGAFPELADPINDVGEFSYDSDIDKDGDRDMLVWISGANYMALYLNDGSGNFSDKSSRLATPDYDDYGSFSIPGVSVTDLDGDGDDDIFMPMFDQAWNFLLIVFENDGDGTFTQVAADKFPAELRPGMSLVDVNGDGLKDFLTDITYNDAWNEDHNNQFTLHLGKLDVAVTRNGWATDDRIFGGSKNDTLRGLRGDDFLQGNAGDDIMGGGIGKDALDGRTGIDTADYSDKSATVSVALNGASKVIVKIGGVIEDTVRRIENVTGGSKNDTLIGDALANRLTGNAGLDTLNGDRGNDTLRGGSGDDTLVGDRGNDILAGGLGRDLMNGGAGADDFDFDTVAETGKTAATRDRIVSFSHGVDDIDLSSIDANGGAPGNSFIFLATEGARFHGVRGELRWFQVNVAVAANDKTIIEGDINGDRKADFQIELAGLKTLTEADFFL